MFQRLSNIKRNLPMALRLLVGEEAPTFIESQRLRELLSATCSISGMDPEPVLLKALLVYLAHKHPNVDVVDTASGRVLVSGDDMLNVGIFGTSVDNDYDEGRLFRERVSWRQFWNRSRS